MTSSIQHEIELWWEIHQFLANEADLLDQRQYDAWLDLFVEEARYWIPLRINRALSDGASEFRAKDEHSYFDDDKDMLRIRVAKLQTSGSWAEDPPSRTRHLFSNLRVARREHGAIIATCNIAVFRSRLAAEEEWFFGRREDVLRAGADGWRIVERTIQLDSAVLRAKNLSILF